jgi:hypothetical protein
VAAFCGTAQAKKDPRAVREKTEGISADYLDGRWWTFDARNNTPRIGRVLMANGRDAARTSPSPHLTIP